MEGVIGIHERGFGFSEGVTITGTESVVLPDRLIDHGFEEADLEVEVYHGDVLVAEVGRTVEGVSAHHLDEAEVGVFPEVGVEVGQKIEGVAPHHLYEAEVVVFPVVEAVVVHHRGEVICLLSQAVVLHPRDVSVRGTEQRDVDARQQTK